jgi:hypothetical protein
MGKRIKFHNEIGVAFWWDVAERKVYDNGGFIVATGCYNLQQARAVVRVRVERQSPRQEA